MEGLKVGRAKAPRENRMSELNISGAGIKKSSAKSLWINLSLLGVTVVCLCVGIALNDTAWKRPQPVSEAARALSKIAPISPALSDLAREAASHPELLSMVEYNAAVAVAVGECMSRSKSKEGIPKSMSRACFEAQQLQARRHVDKS
jgi:hypothetical protein